MDKKMKQLTHWLCVIAGVMTTGYIKAAENDNELAKAALNGLKVNRYAQYIAAPFQEYFNFDYGQQNTQSTLYFKPVVPFQLSPNLDLIVRTIAPLYEQTPTQNAQGVLDGRYIQGWGDINPTFFITPANVKSVIIGLGPTVSIPTATNSQYIGTGKWSLGPELALYSIQKNWVLGFLTNNLWSVAGDSNRTTVSTFQFEYLISYVFDHGWFIESNPSITANWKSATGHKWTIPIGLGAGRTTRLGKQPINLEISGYYNVIRPNKIGPTWQLQLQLEWLFNPIRFA